MEATVLVARKPNYELVSVRGQLFLKQRQEKPRRAGKHFPRF